MNRKKNNLTPDEEYELSHSKKLSDLKIIPESEEEKKELDAEFAQHYQPPYWRIYIYNVARCWRINLLHKKKHPLLRKLLLYVEDNIIT